MPTNPKSKIQNLKLIAQGATGKGQEDGFEIRFAHFDGLDRDASAVQEIDHIGQGAPTALGKNRNATGTEAVAGGFGLG